MKIYKVDLDFAVQHNWNIGICAKIVDVNGNVLLVQRSDSDSYTNVWEMPGGSVDEGENLEEALKREVFEEIGIQNSKVTNYVGFFDFYNIEKNTTKRKFCFEMEISGELKLSVDHKSFKWFSKEEILKFKKQSDSPDNYDIWDDHFNFITQ